MSPENLAFIEEQTRARELISQSAFLDELLQERVRQQKLAEYEDQVTAYYDGLNEAEMEEDRAWGQFAGNHLALSEEELAHARATTRRNLVHKTAHRSSGQRKAPGSDRVGQRAKQSSAR